jgi:ribosome-binding protein aMBF1 (putative translation factor)
MNKHKGMEWGEYYKSLRDRGVVSEEENKERQLRAFLVGQLIEAREQNEMSQTELSKRSGIKQPAIARIESGKSTPTIATLIRILEPLGKTLDIVPIERA